MHNFVLQTPSLQHLAGMKVVAALWNQSDIITQIQPLPIFYPRVAHPLDPAWKKWKEIEENVERKVSALPVPQLLQKHLFNFITPLKMEIMRWRKYHSGGNNHVQVVLPPQFCWTMHGIIDYTKTMKLMAKDDSVSIERRYEYACVNSLEEEAGELIELIPKYRRQDYQTEEYINDEEYYWSKQGDRMLIVHFTCTLSGDVYGLYRLTHPRGNTFKRDLFDLAVMNGDGAMCEYWFKKLSPREKEQVFEDRELEMLVFKHSRAPCLLFYLSLMSEEQQSRMFRECTSVLLIGLLGWPMQSLFMAAAEYGWELMDEDECATVLDAIIDRIRLDYKDYDYLQLFWECWRLTSAEHKQSYVENFGMGYNLLLTGRDEFIQLVPDEAFCLQVEEAFNEISEVHMYESDISDTALMECRERAALMRLTDEEDNMEQRERIECLCQLLDILIKDRKRRRLL